MTWTTSKGNQSANAYPRTLSWIAVSFGGLALFLALGCLILVSNPVGSTVRGYFYSVDSSDPLDLSILSSNNRVSDLPKDDNVSDDSDSQISTSQSSHSLSSSDKSFQEPVVNVTETTDQVIVVPVVSSGSSTDEKLDASDESDPRVPLEDPLKSGPALSSDLPFGDQVKDVTLSSNTSGNNSQSSDTMGTKDMGDNTPPTSPSKDDSGCDLYQGMWVHDPRGPLYTNNTCPVLTQMQNCQGNGRPDNDYENWRWKPEKCDLPRFDPHKFLELMRGKTIAFVGDSVARNQMESLLCILWQVEVPKNRGNKKMQRYYFKSTSTMVVRIWSSWLVKHTNEPVDFALGVAKLHLNAPDEIIMENFLNFDVIVLSSGHWFAKQSVYLLNNEPVGGQLWRPDPKQSPKIKMTVNNIEAFGISVETILRAINTHPNYTGLTIVRSFSPDHYEGGAWNTGGSCTGKTKPLSLGEVVENGFTNAMHDKQVAGFNRSASKSSRTKMMDITRVFEYRHDGHPGPYRSLDPNKLTKRGPDGKPPPQDCLHWCMPGPVDTWNEFVLEIIRRAHQEKEGLNA